MDGIGQSAEVFAFAGVQLVRQISRSACIEGQTWGYARNGIWVSQGCRAEFLGY